MSLGCIIGQEIIRGPFSLIYQIGTNKEGLVYPDKAKDILPPNAAVCAQHLKEVPKAVFKDRPNGIEGKVWAIANGLGHNVFDGSPSEHDVGYREIEAHEELRDEDGNILLDSKGKIKTRLITLKGDLKITGLDFVSDAISLKDLESKDKYQYLTCEDMKRYLPQVLEYLCEGCNKYLKKQD